MASRSILSIGSSYLIMEVIREVISEVIRVISILSIGSSYPSNRTAMSSPGALCTLETIVSMARAPYLWGGVQAPW